MLAGFLQQLFLNGLHQPLAVPGEQLHLFLGGLVGAQQTVFLVISAAMDGGVQNLVQAEHLFRAGGFQQPFGTPAGVDVAAQHVPGVGQDGTGIVGEDNFHLGPTALNELLVVGHVVHAGEGVLLIAEQLPVPRQGEHVLVGIHPLLVHSVQADEVVAHLVGGVTEHEDNLFGPFGNAPQADGKTVAAEDGENHAYRLPAQLGPDIVGNFIHGGVVALGPGHDGLGHGHNVPVAEGKAILGGGLQQGIGYDLHQIVPTADDGGADAPGYGTDHTTHKGNTPHFHIDYPGKLQQLYIIPRCWTIVNIFFC